MRFRWQTKGESELDECRASPREARREAAQLGLFVVTWAVAQAFLASRLGKLPPLSGAMLQFLLIVVSGYLLALAGCGNSAATGDAAQAARTHLRLRSSSTDGKVWFFVGLVSALCLAAWVPGTIGTGEQTWWAALWVFVTCAGMFAWCRALGRRALLTSTKGWVGRAIRVLASHLALVATTLLSGILGLGLMFAPERPEAVATALFAAAMCSVAIAWTQSTVLDWQSAGLVPPSEPVFSFGWRNSARRESRRAETRVLRKWLGITQRVSYLGYLLGIGVALLVFVSFLWYDPERCIEPAIPLIVVCYVLLVAAALAVCFRTLLLGMVHPGPALTSGVGSETHCAWVYARAPILWSTLICCALTMLEGVRFPETLPWQCAISVLIVGVVALCTPALVCIPLSLRPRRGRHLVGAAWIAALAWSIVLPLRQQSVEEVAIAGLRLWMLAALWAVGFACWFFETRARVWNRRCALSSDDASLSSASMRRAGLVSLVVAIGVFGLAGIVGSGAAGRVEAVRSLASARTAAYPAAVPPVTADVVQHVNSARAETREHFGAGSWRHSDACILVGRVLEAEGKTTDALTSYEEALGAASRDRRHGYGAPEAHRSLAAALVKLGRTC